MVKSPVQRANKILLVSLIGTAILGLAVFIGGWFYILKISSEQSKLNAEANSFSRENKILSDLKLSLARLGSDKDVVYEVIPQSKDISDFLKSFEEIVKADKLAILGVNVGDIQKKSKTGSDLSQTVSKDQYYELPIRYEVGGMYPDVTKLLSDINNGKRLASVTNLVVSADYSDKNVVGKVKATFVVTVYVKK